MNNIILGTVSSAVINSDKTYLLNVKSNISDKEYRDCSYLFQNNSVTREDKDIFPKEWDLVLLLIAWQSTYIVLWSIYDKVPLTQVEIWN